MEVATTNNHNHESHHHHHRHHHQHFQQQQQRNITNSSSINTNVSGVRSPFQREVREWQHIDPDTGALLSGRLEADRWVNGPLNSYGKKSSSSISSNSTGSNSSTPAATAQAPIVTTAKNTHNSAGMVSLHAIVSNSTSRSESQSTATSTTTSPWHKQSPHQQQSSQRASQHFEQHALFGRSNKTLNSHVGVTKATAVGGGSGGNGDDDAADDEPHSQHRQANSKETTPTQSQQQSRRDLESFRHYNSPTTAASPLFPLSAQHSGDDNDLRSIDRQQSHRQYPGSEHITPMQRSRSISTDDLSTEWNTYTHTVEEPSEWRRVSKLRRSFQSTTATTAATGASDTYKSPTSTHRRPVDLPVNSVSVSKIRAELENGRRLNTAMRNNRIDLAALNTILNTPAESKSVATKTTSFLTAESLKEIRGKLKRLSDESLYKDDFMAHQQPPAADEHIEVQHHVRKTLDQRLRQLRDTESLSQFSPAEPMVPTAPTTQYLSSFTPKYGHTHSLESRQKNRETAGNDWHIRRKSYGFEKMSPPEDKSMFGMDASTDSGLGRSGELSNWSPTIEAAPATRSTVVHFGDPVKVVTNPIFQKRNQYLKAVQQTDDEHEAPKRHSIAVDESQYIGNNSIRKTSQVHLSGLYHQSAAASSASPTMENLIGSNSSTALLQRATQQKRVEFCKTEVHFAAESGRVNIVETDGKPPPTNNFRRRRRTTASAAGPLQSLVKGAPAVPAASSPTLPVTHFGDDGYQQRKATAGPLATDNLVDTANGELSNVTVSIPKYSQTTYTQSEGSRASYASTSGVDTTDNENDDTSTIRGILKNKPIKPKPYHLGENFDSPDVLWGVQLKPVTATLPAQRAGILPSDGANEIAKNLTADEQLKLTDKRHDHTNGYSTKINVSLGDTHNTWPETELPSTNKMSIALHSPKGKPEILKRTLTPPVARPRTVTNVHQTERTPVAIPTTIKQTSSAIAANVPTREEAIQTIKDARGARQLKEHELAYFGVQLTAADNIAARSRLYTANDVAVATAPRRNLPRRTLNQNYEQQETNTMQKPQTSQRLISDNKPDLLRHSAIAVKPQVITRTAEIKSTERGVAQQPRSERQHSPVHKILEFAEEPLTEDDEHYYENITNDLKPVVKVPTATSAELGSYNRKMDVKRDVMILSEMTKSADQTMKAISDQAAFKDHRRRTVQRQNSQPLETIDEKATHIAERANSNCIAVKVSHEPLAAKTKRASRHTTPSPSTPTMASRARSSSQSSVESCPRARSRSLSSEREYENIAAQPLKQKGTKVLSKKSLNCSSSRESLRSMHTPCSSGDEMCVRVKERELRAAKARRIPSGTNTPTSKPERHSKEPHRSEHKKSVSTHDDKRHRSSRTTHSTQRERSECTKETKSHHHHHSQSTKSGGAASNSHRQRTDDHETHKPGGSPTRSRAVSNGIRLLRSSRNRPEKEKEKDKEKLSRSRDHSSRSTGHHRSSSERNTTTKPHAVATSTKQREHKTSMTTSPPATAATTATEMIPTSRMGHELSHHDQKTSSKNPQYIIDDQQQHYYQQQQHPSHLPEHVHKLTTATIATKHHGRLRNGKDRK